MMGFRALGQAQYEAKLEAKIRELANESRDQGLALINANRRIEDLEHALGDVLDNCDPDYVPMYAEWQELLKAGRK